MSSKNGHALGIREEPICFKNNVRTKECRSGSRFKAASVTQKDLSFHSLGAEDGKFHRTSSIERLRSQI